MGIKAQLEALSTKKDEALAQGRKLLADADEADGGPSADLLAQVDALTADATEADTQIKALLAKDEEVRARIDVMEGFEDHSTAIEGARGVHIQHTPDVGEARMKIPATVRRFGRLANFKGDVGGYSPEERAYRFGQYALARISQDMPGKFHFPQALAFASQQLGLPLAVHGEGAGDTTGAHVFVPDEFGTDLIRLREIYGVARQVALTRTMSSDTRTDPRRTGGLTAYFVGENAAGTESDAAYDNVSLTAKKVMVLTRMSSELSEDSVISFGDELAGEISYAFANKEDECLFNGDGTSTYGGIEGILTKLGALTAGTAPGLTLGAGNAWSELSLANYESIVGSLPVYADVPGQVFWICHKTHYWTVMASLALAAGGVTASEIVNGISRPMFLGYPVMYSQVFPSAEANSQVPVLLGNYAQGATFGDRRRESISFSDTATVGGQSLWERDQIGVKGTERFDIAVHSVGSDTVAGPIVGLETASS